MEIENINLSELSSPRERVRMYVDFILLSKGVKNSTISKLITSFVLRHDKGIVTLDKSSRNLISAENNFKQGNLSSNISFSLNAGFVKRIKNNTFELNESFRINPNNKQFEIGLVIR
jgi:hypothetical protein